MQICTVPTVLTARRHLEAPSMPRVQINRTTTTPANMTVKLGSSMNRTDRTNSGHVRPLSAPHPDGQTRTSPYRGVQLSGGGDWRWGDACGVVSLLRIPKLTRQCKRATRKPPPVCLSGDQNLRSKLSAKLERLLSRIDASRALPSMWSRLIPKPAIIAASCKPHDRAVRGAGPTSPDWPTRAWEYAC